jgi:hypothetical protein
VIRPISDGRPGFGDFLDRDLWFHDFLIIMSARAALPSWVEIFFGG